MDLQELADLQPGTFVKHSLFGDGYVEEVKPTSVLIDFGEHGRKELQISFCADRISLGVRPNLSEEVEILVKHGLLLPSVARAEMAALRASGEEPKAYFTRRSKLIETPPIDYDELARETVEMESNRGKDYRALVNSMVRAARGQADPIQCLIAIRAALKATA